MRGRLDVHGEVTHGLGGHAQHPQDPQESGQGDNNEGHYGTNLTAEGRRMDMKRGGSYACPWRLRNVHSTTSSPIASRKSSGFDHTSMVRRLPTRTLRGGLTLGLLKEPSRNSPPLAWAISRKISLRAMTSSSSWPSGRTTSVTCSSTGRLPSTARATKRYAPGSISPSSTWDSPSPFVVTLSVRRGLSVVAASAVRRSNATSTATAGVKSARNVRTRSETA